MDRSITLVVPLQQLGDKHIAAHNVGERFYGVILASDVEDCLVLVVAQCKVLLAFCELLLQH